MNIRSSTVDLMGGFTQHCLARVDNVLFRLLRRRRYKLTEKELIVVKKDSPRSLLDKSLLASFSFLNSADLHLQYFSFSLGPRWTFYRG
jgi:hypothetical protein